MPVKRKPYILLAGHGIILQLVLDGYQSIFPVWGNLLYHSILILIKNKEKQFLQLEKQKKDAQTEPSNLIPYLGKS